MIPCSVRHAGLGLVALFLLVAGPSAGSQSQPQRPATYGELTKRLQAADEASLLVAVESVGKSVEGRDLWMARLSPEHQKAGNAAPAFLHARQHGNEPAGQEALIQLVEDVAAGKTKLSYPVLAIPCVNPDGAEKNDRRNANRMDLNRDHLILSQPETRSLHAAFRKAQPRMAVDCHEFGRDSSDYAVQGWSEWPLIMVDCANFPHPSLDPIYQRSTQLIERISKTMTAEGFNTCRYIVGDAPPAGEVRYSTLEGDDGRNSLGLYGIPSYIIESGLYRNVDDSNGDLQQRVAAYRRLLGLLLDEAKDHPITPARALNGPLVPLLPVNNFWGMTRLQPNMTVPVVEQATSRTIQVPARQVMSERVVKTVVALPQAYAIVPRSNLETYQALLRAHDLPFEVLETSTTRRTVRHRLTQIERETDPVYQRFGGRQVMTALPEDEETLPKGTLVVSLKEADSLRAAVVLDPRMLYGLYQHREFQEGLEEQGVVPVRLLPSVAPGTTP